MVQKLKQRKEQLTQIANELGKELSYTKVVVICKLQNSNTSIEFANQTRSGAIQKTLELFPKAVIKRTIGFCRQLNF